MSLHVRRDADDADAVVGRGGDQARHLRAVAIAAKRDVVVVDVVARDLRAAGEIGMSRVDAGVDDGDANAGAAAEVVRLGDVERAARSTAGARTGRRTARAGGASVADSNSLSGCTMSTRLSAFSFSMTASRVVPGGIRNSTQCICSCSIGHSDTSVSEYCARDARGSAAVADALTR